jgi:hypothetical protein
MGKNWAAILSVKGDDWNIPAAEVQVLSALVGAADSILAVAENESTRTKVVTAQCRAAFKALEDKMRDIKRRCFFVPPLTDADLIALGLVPGDPVRTPSGKPEDQVRAEIFLVGPHELGVRIVYVTGGPDNPANKEYRIWYLAVPPGGQAPTDPEDLPNSFSTMRKKDVIEFEYGDSGKTAYIAVQIENDGKKGPWGPMVSAVIP